jgi:hypothetical protein
MPYEWSAVTMAWNSKTLASKPFAMTLGLEHQFSSLYTPPQNGVVERKNRTLWRWLGRCSMSIGLREGSGLRRSIPRAMFRTGSTSESTRRKPVKS